MAATRGDSRTRRVAPRCRNGDHAVMPRVWGEVEKTCLPPDQPSIRPPWRPRLPTARTLRGSIHCPRPSGCDNRNPPRPTRDRRLLMARRVSRSTSLALQPAANEAVAKMWPMRHLVRPSLGPVPVRYRRARVICAMHELTLHCNGRDFDPRSADQARNLHGGSGRFRIWHELLIDLVHHWHVV
jgi:hypothetical protein